MKNFTVEVISRTGKTGEKYAVRVLRDAEVFRYRLFGTGVTKTKVEMWGRWGRNSLPEVVNDYYALWSDSEIEIRRLCDLLAQMDLPVVNVEEHCGWD